ncbi:succinylarginine dihydrolase [Verrucomicrobia bacterium SCGC AG-212-E04]|nr:succinylarginine dihydrolase [Verrucomicrobia bacterium SCGC AG-212-E04]
MAATFEVNFDGLVGPTHNYAGLAVGNEASRRNQRAISHPREAALQGLAKMKALADLGLKQAVLPPLERPAMHVLRRLGFDPTDDANALRQAERDAPEILSACLSASNMWVANAATICPSADAADGRVHFTPANLIGNFHRSIEASDTALVLRRIFGHESRFAHHEPLPAVGGFGDEGAANHTRFCMRYGGRGVHFFVYGQAGLGESQGRPARYPARQTREASEAIARLHRIPADQAVFAQQTPEAIDAGVFHNDVIATGNERLHVYHEQAFVDREKTIDALADRFVAVTGGALHSIMVSRDELSLDESVACYLFNSQVVTLPSGAMALIAPSECEDHPGARRMIERMIADPMSPLAEVRYLDLRQSMRNGGGPACLRLRVVLTEDEIASLPPGVFLNKRTYALLTAWVSRHYRESLAPDELASPALLLEARLALDELTKILGLGSIYHFQHA